MIYNNHFMFKNKINPLLLKLRNILETQKTHPQGQVSVLYSSARLSFTF